MKITLPTKLNVIAASRASERGCRNVNEYVHTLIEEDATTPLSAEMESELLKRLSSASTRAASKFWDGRRRKLQPAQRRTNAR